MFKKRNPEEDKNTSTLGNIPPKPTATPTISPTTPTPGPKMATTPKGPSSFAPPPQNQRPTQPQPTGPYSHNAHTSQRNPSRTLVVGSGISVQGTILDAECLIVEGTVDADSLSAQELIVVQGGTFRGTIDVENAELSGTIDGNLTARNCLTVQSTGRLIGKAECRRLQVEDGGQITGELNVITTPIATSSEQTRAAE